MDSASLNEQSMHGGFSKFRFSLGMLATCFMVMGIQTECEARRKPPVRRYHRQVAMAFRKTTPPMLITYFTQNPTPESDGGSSHRSSTEKRSRFYLGVGFVGTIVRDSVLAPGSPLIAYGGGAVQALWQFQPRWLVRGAAGYVSRTFSPAQDPTGGIGQVGQYWTGNLSVEYAWLRTDSFSLSSGLSGLVSYGYRSRNYFTGPSLGRATYFKAGASTTARYEVFSGVDLYAEGQWLFGVGQPWDSQGIAGAGILFGL